MIRARSFRQTISGRTPIRAGVATSALLVAGMLSGVSPASAATVVAAPVDLGSAAGFSVLGGATVTNTGTATTLALDLGATGANVGFTPGMVEGATYAADAVVEEAQSDRQAAYDGVVAQTGGTAFGGDLAGTTFTPGLYTTDAAVTNTGTITLDAAGDPSAIFVFKVGAALSSAASTKVVLKNGALANNVYWQAVGAVSLGADVKWVGTLLAGGVVSFGDGASLKGRILTSGTVALANSPITKPIDDLLAPVVAISGGTARSTNDTTPLISGTTDEPGTPLVTVAVASQVLTARAADGVWSMSAGTLAPGAHTVDASVTDPSGNIGTATQELTVDAGAPGITIAGGATTDTNDTTPTIRGTTDEPGTPLVTVTVGGQTLTGTAADGAWSVDATSLTEASHLVQASVEDAAGNTGTAGQVLTVDITVPVLTIDGGAARSTSDTSPWTYGTTAEKAGSIVRVSLGGQALQATVQPGGAWGVSAESLPSATYVVLATVTDAAGNKGSMNQTLQVGNVVTTPGGATPPVGLDGGATASTNDSTPTISGTTSEPGNPTVVVTVGGQTLTTRAAAGVWSVQAAPLADGPHTVVVRITDAAGNITSTTQELTISSVPPVAPPVTPPATSPVSPPAAAASHRPDAEIRLGKRSYVGKGSYSVSRQRVTSTLNGRRAKTGTFQVRLTNRGTVADRLTIRGTRKNKQFTVVYSVGRKNVTSAVLKGTYRTTSLRPGQSVTVTVRVTKVKGVKKGSKRTFTIRAVSTQDRSKADTVAAVGKVARG